MKSLETRKKFIDFFKDRKHHPVSSSSLVPHNDPTLLFTNAGMNQFKNLFLGLEQREYARAVSSQKCVRAGGKHNDLESVGHTARHHTFFEMLGNFSFGDYFKKDAIHFAWEFLTHTLSLPKDRLFISVFQDDDEAAEIWHKQEKIPKDRIYRFGEKDNFWRMGDSGPCGPCSEIFYDLGPEVPGDPKENVMGGSGDRYMEIWNLVFMQFFEDGKGGRTPLPKPSVDTGMGLERLCAVLQGELSNYHTDLFMDLIRVAEKVTATKYDKSAKGKNESNVAMRVLADHARASAFLIADGVLPSNEGRGYVLRRILRRAIRYGRTLTDQSVLPAVVESVVQKMSDPYVELNRQKTLVLTTVRDEESRFLTTLDQGTHLLQDEFRRLNERGRKTLEGETVFKLYDTFGFPADLTRLMAEENGFQIDESGFERKMDEAREKARASWKGKGLSADQAHIVKWTQKLQKDNGPTTFSGYSSTTESSTLILGLTDGKSDVKSLAQDQTGMVALKSTPFYAEGGGQVGDAGVLRGPKGQAEVLDCTRENDVYLHHVRIVEGTLSLNETCHAEVLDSKRRATANNHSATHLMHAALRQVLGDHVTQAGSLVDSTRLRFDFTHNKPLTEDEIQRVERLVNQEIGAARPVESAQMSYKDALKAGAMALFGEKYGEDVRVIRMGDFSMELCGGTHVSNTSVIRVFKIISEGGVSAGVRRIEALTGDAAVDYLLRSTHEDLAARGKVGIPAEQSLLEWIEKTQKEIKALERKIQSAQSGQVDIDSLVRDAKEFVAKGKSGKLVFADLPLEDRKVLSEISDKLRDKLQSGVIVIVGQGEKSHPVVVSVSKNLVPDINAGKILGEVAATMGGKGGGRPDFAQGAVPDRSRINTAREKVIGCLATS